LARIVFTAFGLAPSIGSDLEADEWKVWLRVVLNIMIPIAFASVGRDIVPTHDVGSTCFEVHA
jgi:hypothetical protein